MGLDDLILLASASTAVAAGAAALLWAVYARCYVTVPPNRALVLFGRRATHVTTDPGISPTDVDVHRPRIMVGGGVFVAPWNKGVGRLSLDPVSVDICVRSMHALDGARASGWEVRLQVQAKIPAEPSALTRAAENLLGRTDEEIRGFLRRAVEATVPAVLSRLRPSEGEPDWDHLAAEIQASAAPDLVTWGFMIQSLSVTELRRILPAEPPSNVSLSKPTGTSPADGRKVDALLNGLDARMARAERNLGLVGAAVARIYREAIAPEERPGAFSVLDLPLGSELPASVAPTESAFASLHESMEDERLSSLRPVPPEGPRVEADGDPRTPLE